MLLKWIALVLLPTTLALALGSDKAIDQTARSVADSPSVPFQAAIQGLENPIPLCEGALISPNYVLTSALCLRGLPDGIDLSTFPFRIVLGVDDYSVTDNTKNSFIIDSRVQSPNNFALLKLAEPVEISSNINYVCLPTTAAVEGYAQEKMTHSTWLPGSTTLSQNEVNGLADETCQAKIKDLGSTQMCGSKISSSSNVMLVNYGYGGAPLTAPIGGKRTLVGILSGNFNPPESDAPLVYGRVDLALDWIFENSDAADYRC